MTTHKNGTNDSAGAGSIRWTSGRPLCRGIQRSNGHAPSRYEVTSVAQHVTCEKCKAKLDKLARPAAVKLGGGLEVDRGGLWMVL